MELGTHGLDILSQASEAFMRKSSLDGFWQQVAELHFPERANFTVDKGLGEDMVSNLYSSEPVLFRREFGNFLGAVLRPKGREWFKPRARDERTNKIVRVRSYLEEKGRVTRDLLYDPKSQFSRAMTTADHDWATFGNGVTSIEERRDKSGFRFRTWHLKDCAWRENYDGEVDTMFRRIKVKIRNLVKKEREGWSLSPKVTQRLDKEPDGEVTLYHITMPTLDYDYSKKKKLKLDHVSVYIDADHKWLVSEKAIPEFNYQVSRWFTMDGSPYAFSPCVMASMPDAATVQSMMWSIIEAGEKAVEPPLVATHEAVLGGVSVRSGEITWVDRVYDERTGEAVRALELGSQPQFGQHLHAALVQNMNAAWFLNKLFLPQGGPQRTAEEVVRWNEEFIRATQPIIDPAEAERNGLLLDPLISMAIRLGYWGSIKEMPSELKGRHVDVTYDNPIEDARKMAKTNAYQVSMGIVGLASQFSQATTAQFDHNTAFRDAISGVAPPDWLLPEDEAEKEVQSAKDIETANAAANDVASMAIAQNKAGMVPKQPAMAQ